MATNEDKRTQYGSLPYKVEANGSLRLLLVTSRETKRWVVPKGWPIKEMKPHEAASLEAFEEAGARGTADKRAVGSYVYRKPSSTRSRWRSWSGCGQRSWNENGNGLTLSRLPRW